MTDLDRFNRNMRRAVLALGTLLALFFLLAIGPKMIGDLLGTDPSPARDPSPDRDWEGRIMYATIFTFLLGYAVGWWRRLWGGVLMVLAALIIAVPFLLIAKNQGALIFAIPQLLVGAGYFGLYFAEKNQGRTRINS